MFYGNGNNMLAELFMSIGYAENCQIVRFGTATGKIIFSDSALICFAISRRLSFRALLAFWPSLYKEEGLP